jgi:hypothetical protein
MRASLRTGWRGAQRPAHPDKSLLKRRGSGSGDASASASGGGSASANRPRAESQRDQETLEAAWGESHGGQQHAPSHSRAAPVRDKHAGRAPAHAPSGFVDLGSDDDVEEPAPREQPAQPARTTRSVESAAEPVVIRSRRTSLGKWNCGPAEVTIGGDRITWFPADKHPMPGTDEFPLISLPVATVTRFEIDKVRGGLCFWSLHEFPFSQRIYNEFSPFVAPGAREPPPRIPPAQTRYPARACGASEGSRCAYRHAHSRRPLTVAAPLARRGARVFDLHRVRPKRLGVDLGGVSVQIDPQFEEVEGAVQVRGAGQDNWPAKRRAGETGRAD